MKPWYERNSPRVATDGQDEDARVESGREYNAREDIEAGVRIPVLVQIKKWSCTSRVGCCNIRHTDYGGVNESLGYILRQCAGKGSLTTFAGVKQTSKERGFDSHQDL